MRKQLCIALLFIASAAANASPSDSYDLISMDEANPHVALAYDFEHGNPNDSDLVSRHARTSESCEYDAQPEYEHGNANDKDIQTRHSRSVEYFDLVSVDEVNPHGLK